MDPPASGHRAPSTQGYITTPPYAIPRPELLRLATERVGITRPGTPYHLPAHPVSHLSRRTTAANSTVKPSTSSVFPSPQRFEHTSKLGSFRAPQEPSELIKNAPISQVPPSTLTRVPSAAVPHLHPYTASWGRGHGFPVPSQRPSTPSPFQNAGMQRQGSQHTVYQQTPAGMYQVTTATHVSQHSHRPSIHHQPSTSHHHTRHRSRSRPPSAASHRYASSITQPVYGHGSSASSHTSLNGDVPQRVHRASTPPPGVPFSHHAETELARAPSALLHRSHSHSHSHLPHDAFETTAATHWTHRLEKHPQRPPSPPLAARELRRSTHRRALPANYDGRTQTRYVNMLLALDGISPLFNILAAFFTWILLAGFLLFPGTFASWQNLPAGSPQSDILNVVNHVPLYVIAWLCTGIGAAGMIWLWWRWYNNYIWITNRIFIPGCLNSLAGIISTLSSIYGAHAGALGKSAKSTIVVTSALALICGTLALVYELWFIRNLRLEHDRIVGVEKAGKHGEGILGARRHGQG